MDHFTKQISKKQHKTILWNWKCGPRTAVPLTVSWAKSYLKEDHHMNQQPLFLWPMRGQQISQNQVFFPLWSLKSPRSRVPTRVERSAFRTFLLSNSCPVQMLRCKKRTLLQHVCVHAIDSGAKAASGKWLPPQGPPRGSAFPEKINVCIVLSGFVLITPPLLLPNEYHIPRGHRWEENITPLWFSPSRHSWNENHTGGAIGAACRHHPFTPKAEDHPSLLVYGCGLRSGQDGVINHKHDLNTGAGGCLKQTTAYHSLHKSKTKSHPAEGYGSGSGDSSIWFMARCALLSCPPLGGTIHRSQQMLFPSLRSSLCFQWTGNVIPDVFFFPLCKNKARIWHVS